MRLSSLSLWKHRPSKAKCHTFHLFTLSCGLLIAWVEHSLIEARLKQWWERGLPSAGGPGEGWWQQATRQESNKTDKWCQDTQKTETPHHHNRLLSSHRRSSHKHSSSALAAPTAPPLSNTTSRPSPLQRTGQLLLNTRLFTDQRFPSGFGSMGLYFL